MDGSTVRVFVSSTFHDMLAEREVFAKRVLPRLRELCAAHGLLAVDVDLRWGVTAEQITGHETLALCLDEVERSDILIGFIGARYGSRLPASQEEVEARPWLAHHPSASITELELRCGALNDSPACAHALVYLRDHSDSGSTENADSARRLDSLKATLKQDLNPPPRTYSSPDDLEELLATDLSTLVKTALATRVPTDPDMLEAWRHLSFASRPSPVWSGSRQTTARLHRHANKSGPPLVVIGKPESGKSALLASWTLARQRDPREGSNGGRGFIDYLSTKLRPSSSAEVEHVMFHAAGAVHDADALDDLLRRLLIALDTPVRGSHVTRTDLVAATRIGLSTYSLSTPLLVVIDGLDQLGGVDEWTGLAWLPEKLSKQVRVVLAVRPGALAETLTRRGCKTLDIHNPSQADRKRLVETHLKQLQGKQLEPDLLNEYCAHDRSPAFLIAGLEELRHAQGANELAEAVRSIVAKPDLESLLTQVVHRMEGDYNTMTHPALVKTVMQHLACSRRGLTESDLRELASDGDPVPALTWAPFMAALRPLLLERVGHLSIGTHTLHRVVQDLYLAADGAREVHLRTARHLETRALSNRTAEELPWQYVGASEFAALSRLLSSSPFIAASWKRHRLDLLELWSLATEAGHDPTPRMLATIASVAEPRQLRICGLLLAERGDVQPALQLGLRALRSAEGGDDREQLEALVFLSGMLLRLEQFDDSEELVVRLERASRAQGNNEVLAVAMGHHAALARARGDRRKELQHLHDQERLGEQLQRVSIQIHSLTAQAQIAIAATDATTALDILKRQTALARSAADHEALLDGLSRLAITFTELSQYDEALKTHDEEQQLALRLDDAEVYQQSLINRTLIILASGRYGDAAKPLRECELSLEQQAKPSSVIQAQLRLRQAELASLLGQSAIAIRTAQEAVKLSSGLRREDIEGPARRLLAAITNDTPD